MGDFPATVREAQDHIEEIRRQKGLGRPTYNNDDLERALVLLSEELYQKPTHFLLELIQNADDNHYVEKFPTLSIRLESGHLWLSCNEVGFSKQNVEAICRIQRSTKVGPENIRGYTGEKGIGFKSVFKIADTVWIRSGHYSFKFDKEAALGMIAPIWADFPGAHTSGSTSMCLRLLKDYPQDSLAEEIMGMNSSLLLFLRRLRRLCLSIRSEAGPWFTTIEVEDSQSQLRRDLSIQRGMVIREGPHRHTYAVCQSTVRNLPAEPKRLGVTETHITLAFPLRGSDTSLSPRLEYVYAFLPIRQFGFKVYTARYDQSVTRVCAVSLTGGIEFLLHADFLLNTSREDIDESSAWNQALRSALPRALAEAITWLSQGRSVLQYTWLSFLPERSPMNDFFKDIDCAVFDILRKAPILESTLQEMKAPGELTFVPRMFHDADGLPFISPTKTRGDVAYLSPKYPADSDRFLHRLGVGQLSNDVFLAELRSFMLASPTAYYEKPGRWHSSLAATLVSLLHSHEPTHQKILDMTLVPLRDGRWVTARDEGIVLSANTGDLTLPVDIDALVVDPDVGADRHRRALFTALGIREMSRSRICDLLAEFHSKSQDPSKGVSPLDIVSHVKFMYRTGWNNPRKHDLWFLSEDREMRRGSHLYMQSTAPYSATRYVHSVEPKINFLHSQYMGIDTESTDRLAGWLARHHGICAMPRLVHPPKGAPFVLSREFTCILSSYPDSEILSLLRAHWPYYNQWVLPGISYDSPNPAMWEQSRRALVRALSDMSVTCFGEKKHKLKGVAVPSRAVLDSCGADSRPFLQVPEPDDENWDFLHNFGVVTSSALTESISSATRHYVHRLEVLRDSGEASFADIVHQYREMAGCDEDDMRSLRKLFESRPLIYVPDVGWHKSSQCRWLGEKVLKRTPLLAKHYPDLDMFFCTRLQIPNADLETVVAEMLQFQQSDSIQYISDMFSTLARLLPDEAGFSQSSIAETLRDSAIFPVRDDKSMSSFHRLEDAKESSTWLFVDQAHLQRCFEGRVPLLAFTKRDIQQMSRVFTLLGLNERKLSVQAKAEQCISRAVAFQPSITRRLRQKARFVAGLIPKSRDTRTSVVTKIRGAKVYLAEELTTRWSLALWDGSSVVGRTERGRGQFHNGDGGIEIYITKDDEDRMALPIDVVEELVRYSNTEGDSEARWALHYVFNERDLNLIEDFLDRRGLLQDSIEDWSLIESDFNREDLAPKCPAAFSDLPIIGREEIDAMTDFLDHMEYSRKMDATLKRNWDDCSIKKATLSQVCRLEKQDASVFLPLDLIERKGGVGKGHISPAFFSSWPDTFQGGYNTTDILLPGVLRVKTSGEQDLVICGPAYNDVDDEMRLFGELYVSRLLQTHLEGNFNPDAHWTSTLRSRAGYKPFTLEKQYRSAFTIEDTSKAFWKFLARGGLGIPVGKAEYMTFHIDVVTVERDIKDCPFYMHPKQFDQIRRFSVSPEMMLMLKPNISILMVVSSILGDPHVSTFVDPWKLYVEGSLKLEFPAHFRASFNDNIPSHIPLRHPIGSDELRRPAFRKSITRLLRIAGENEYRYKTLAGFRRFRLLELLPGEDQDPLQGKIHARSLDSNIQYSAISYTWGANMKPYKLSTPGGTIWITASCDSALRRLRHASESRTFWIDAICIDQENSHEKASQIRLMRDIFQRAAMVYGWIGEESDGSEAAIQVLSQIRALENSVDPWPADLPQPPDTWSPQGIPRQEDEVWEAIDRLFARPWFSRAWIAQEMVLASKLEIICGGARISWEHLFGSLRLALNRANMMIEYGEMAPGKALQTTEAACVLGSTRQLYSGGTVGFKLDLLTLLHHFSHTKSSVEEDKLFALLSLASDADSEVFNPDYSSLEQVVRRYAREFVYRDKTLDLLYRAGSATSYGFCSWIPCWTSGTNLRTISTWKSRKGPFNARGGTLRACPLHTDRNLLQISAAIVDSVADVGDVTMGDSDIWAYLNSIHEFLERLPSYPTRESIQDVKVKLPVGDAARPFLEREGDLHVSATPSPTDTDLDEEVDSIPWGARVPKFPTVEAFLSFFRGPLSLREAMWKYWQTVAAFSLRLSHGRVFATKGHYAGLAPPATQRGDLVVLIDGASVPFVLRHMEADQYELIGECYVHGMMHGESRKRGLGRSQIILMR